MFNHFPSAPGHAVYPSAILPPSIMPVVVLSGTDYQMGYQYGVQAAPYIAWKKNATWVAALKKLGSREAINRELEGAEHYTETSVPEAIAMMRGMADGAKAAGYEVSYRDVLLINSVFRRSPESDYRPTGAAKAAPSGEECSCWSAWGKTTENGRLMTAKSSDSEFDPQVTIIAFPEEGNNYLATAPAGELSDTPCMNNQGLFIGSTGGFAVRAIDSGPGISTTCGYQHLLRFTGSAREAKDMFLSWKYPRATNVQFSDATGDACVVEITAAISRVRQPGDFGETDFIYATNNYFTDDLREAIKGERFIEHGGWLGRGASIHSLPRNLEIWNMLYNYRGKIDLDFARMMWRFPGSPPPYPLDEKTYEATQGEGWDQKICNRDNRRVAIMLPERGNGGVAYVCTGTAGRLAHPLKPKGGDWYQIAGTNTFYQLVLAENPLAVGERAKDEAHRCIAAAYRHLAALTYRDPGYGVLQELFSQANTEYYEGVFFLDKGALAEGNEEVFHLARAATAFTRSQAHAQQLSEAIVPPPASPQDLGLPPYGGDWAAWAAK